MSVEGAMVWFAPTPRSLALSDPGATWYLRGERAQLWGRCQRERAVATTTSGTRHT